MSDLLGRPISGNIESGRTYRVEQKTPEEFIEQLDALFALGVAKVRWCQYTPYFNDGDPCYFRPGELSVLKPGTEEDENGEGEGDYGDNFVDEWSLRPENGEWGDDEDGNRKYLYEGDHPLYEALTNFRLGAYEDVLLDAFGDHATVTATPEGFSVEFYEHD